MCLLGAGVSTEAFRSMQAATTGPLSRFQGRTVTADDLLALTPPAGLDQLARFREVFESTLLPQLASRTGPWTLGPTFAGSALIGGADGDLIAAGLLLELKTSSRLSLPVTDMLQVIGYPGPRPGTRPEALRASSRRSRRGPGERALAGNRPAPWPTNPSP